jgi:KUP system potassium uptake protein
MGHFNRRAIQLGFTCVLYPSVLLSYFGQIAFVSVYPDQVPTAFYGSIPPSLFWPQFIFATLAAIVASQAMITGAFSIIKQSMALSCFPRVQIIHTSTTHEGQIYVPTVNYILLVLTIAVTAGFGNGTSIGNAYGVTVLMVMTLTTTLVSIVMLVSWDLSIWVVLPFFLFYFGLDSVFFSSTLYKVPQGGWFPLAMAGCLLCIMYTWHFGTYKKRHYAREHEVSEQSLALLLERCTPIDGVAVVYNDYGEGTVPPALVHYLSNIPSMQRVVVCLTVSQLPVPKLDDARRLLVENMSCNGKPIPGFFRAVVYYGYTEMWDHGRDFLDGLYARIMECAKLSDEPRRREAQRRTEGGVTLEVGAAGAGRPVEGSVQGEETEESVVALGEGGDIDEEINTWLYRDAPEAYTGNQLLDAAWAYNQVYFMGRTSLVPAENARMTTKLLVPAYGLLRAIFNTQAAALKVPTDRLLEVGMVYTAT